MKRMIICCMVLALALSCLGCFPRPQISEPLGVLPTIRVECYFDEEIYINRTDHSIDVTVQVTDNCEGFDSQACLIDTEGVQHSDFEIPDGQTRTGTFAVLPGWKIELDCSGSEGNCTYTISVP